MSRFDETRGTRSLKQIDALIVRIRLLGALRERTPGSFYVKSSGILHFHEDPKGMFADLKRDGEWYRVPVNTRAEQNKLIRLLTEALGH